MADAVAGTVTENDETVETEKGSTQEVQTPEEKAETAKAAATETKETYTKDEYEAAVKQGVAEIVEAKILERVGRMTGKIKTAEESLAAKTEELEKLKTDSSTVENDLAATKLDALKYQIAFENKLKSDSLDLLTGNSEDELRAKAAAILKIAGSEKQETSFSDLYGGKDYTQPPAEPSTFASAYEKLT